MTDRYECWRCTKKLKRFVIYPEGRYYDMPQEVRHLGPWTDSRRGDVVRLKPEYRLALARDGYVVIWEATLPFSPEV